MMNRREFFATNAALAAGAVVPEAKPAYGMIWPTRLGLIPVCGHDGHWVNAETRCCCTCGKTEKQIIIEGTASRCIRFKLFEPIKSHSRLPQDT